MLLATPLARMRAADINSRACARIVAVCIFACCSREEFARVRAEIARVRVGNRIRMRHTFPSLRAELLRYTQHVFRTYVIDIVAQVLVLL